MRTYCKRCCGVLWPHGPKEHKCKETMKVLAFLQNMWFKDPERANLLLQRYEKHHNDDGCGRERFIRDMLFLRCLTGKRLQAAFTWDVCAEIIWEESSKDMGGHSAAKFAADPEHMKAVIEKHKPDVIMVFGKVAYDGIMLLKQYPTIDAYLQAIGGVMVGPHPAARGGNVVKELASMATRLANVKVFSTILGIKE